MNDPTLDLPNSFIQPFIDALLTNGWEQTDPSILWRPGQTLTIEMAPTTAKIGYFVVHLSRYEEINSVVINQSTDPKALVHTIEAWRCQTFG